MGREAVAIRAANARDDAAIARIYNHYVTHDSATFELVPVPAEEIARRRAQAPREVPWLVAIERARPLGYACIAGWKPRAAYRDTVEVSVYVAPGHHRRGLGAGLYAALLPRVLAAGFHAVLAGITLPNTASIALHERFGFRCVGRFREVGHKFGRRIDVGYWQLLAPGAERAARGDGDP